MKVIIDNTILDNIAEVQLNISECNTEVCIVGYEKPNEELLKSFIASSNALGDGALSYPELGMWALLLVYNKPQITIQK